MVNDSVIDAVEEILRQEGVFDEIKKTLFLSVSNVVKKQKPIEINTKAKTFSESADGKYSLLLVAELLESLKMNHSLEMFSLESGFTSTSDMKHDLEVKIGAKFSASGGPLLHQIVTGAAAAAAFPRGGTPSKTGVSGDKHMDAKSPAASPHEELKSAHPKKNRSPLAQHSSLTLKSTGLDLESSYDADEKSTSSMDRRHFSPSKERKKKGELSPLGPSPSRISSLPLASLHDVKAHGSHGLPPLDSLASSKRSPLSKLSAGSRTNSSDDLHHDALAVSRNHHDHLEDSFDQSLDEKLEDSKDGFEISSSFEHSDVNLKPLVSPQGKQAGGLAPLHDALSPYSTNSGKQNKSYPLDDSQADDELASASFLEESMVSEVSQSSANNFDDEDCMLLDSPKKSATNPTQINRVAVKQREQESSHDPAADDKEHVNVTVSTASTVRVTRSQVGWDNNDEKDRSDDDFEYVETTSGSESKPSRSTSSGTGGGGGGGGGGDRGNKFSAAEEKERDVEDFDMNSDFDSIEDMDAEADNTKYDDEDDESGLNVSHTSHRSNQEEDEEENSRLNSARRTHNGQEDKDRSTKQVASGSLFASPTRDSKDQHSSLASPPRSNKKKSLDETNDYEDDYGDDFDQDEEEEEEEEELDESIAESVEEDVGSEQDQDEDQDKLSVGSKHDSDEGEGEGEDSDKDKSYMSSPAQSPTSKLPSLFTKSNVSKETKKEVAKKLNHSQDSDPFQDKSASFSDDGPETSLASGDDLEDFSVGEASTGSAEFLQDDDNSASASATDLSVKDQRSVGRLGESNDFSMSENEISGSHNLHEFGVDYTTSAAPPAGRRGGW